MIINALSHTIALLPEKAIYLPDEKILIVSDVHLGKITHFRKAGIALPVPAKMKSLEKLKKLTESINPQKLVLLGDFFHSDWNTDWNTIEQTLKKWQNMEIILIGGNHDVLALTHYESAGINIKPDLQIGNLFLTHEPEDSVQAGVCNIAGHIHPAVILKGKGKQKMRLPCFLYNEQCLLLPAFGEFTGSYVVKLSKKDRVFIIAGSEVWEAGTGVFPSGT